MFKLKVNEEKHKQISSRLDLVETANYQYVLTNSKSEVEEDKINIVFNEADIPKVNQLLDWIVKGEEIMITGSNQYGQKSVESSNIQYFIVEGETVYGVLQNTRLIVRLKLYEIEELLMPKDFIRVSKYCLVNIGKIDYIKPALNSKLDLLMKNKEHIEVNRAYLKDFKAALKI